MLTLLIIIPILGSIMILPMANTTESQEKMKLIALLTSLLNLIISLFIWFQFDSSTTQYQFINFQDIPNITNSIEWSAYELSRQFSFKFGIDGISLYFVLLTTFITPVALLSNYKNITENIKAYLIIILLLETLQICTFLALDLLLFYIFFESVLPLLFILIIS